MSKKQYNERDRLRSREMKVFPLRRRILFERRVKPSVAAQAPAPCGVQPDMERIVSEYGSALTRICFLYLKDTYLAQDAVQDTFLKVYRNYTQFDASASEKTWVMRIAINVCKDYLRSAWHRRVNVVEALNEVPAEPDAHADDSLLLEVMRLKPRYKEVILLFYYQDMKISEIAKVLGAPESTVAVRLKRAREQLKKRLEGWYADGK